MRLPTDFLPRFLALGLTTLLAACGFGQSASSNYSSVPETLPETARLGPMGDYPVVIGEPYSIDGQLYTPKATLNYDEVGYAAADPEGGTGITASHKTLPLPTYVEITSLESGKTILVRVERRGPMTNERLSGLSPGAQAELGIGDGSPIRVRRVNPPEVDRMKLRMGQAATERMDTPESLITVLKRKLPENGSISLTQSGEPEQLVQQAAPSAAPRSKAADTPQVQAIPAATVPSPTVVLKTTSFVEAFTETPPAPDAIPAVSDGESAAGKIAQQAAPEGNTTTDVPQAHAIPAVANSESATNSVEAETSEFSEDRKAVVTYPLPPLSD